MSTEKKSIALIDHNACIRQKLQEHAIMEYVVSQVSRKSQVVVFLIVTTLILVGVVIIKVMIWSGGYENVTSCL